MNEIKEAICNCNNRKEDPLAHGVCENCGGDIIQEAQPPERPVNARFQLLNRGQSIEKQR